MKKTFISILCICLVVATGFLLRPKQAQAAITRVQKFSGTDTGFASSVTTSPAVTVTAGDLIVCASESDTVALNGITMTDSKSNGWSRFKSVSVAATFDLEVWYAVATTGGSSYTVTATDNGGGVDSLLICEEWSGAASVSPQDVTAGTSGSGTALNSGASSATSQANEAVFGAGSASGNVTMTAGGSFTNLNKVNTTFSTLALESQIVSATGAQTATMTAGTSGSWAAIVATFKEASGGGGSTPGVNRGLVITGKTIITGKLTVY